MLPCLFIHLSLFYQTFMLFRLFIIINSNQQNVSNIRFQSVSYTHLTLPTNREV